MDLHFVLGIGLNLMRHTIGQSDLTPSWVGRWSFDQNNDLPDPSLTNFGLTNQGNRMVSWLQKMMAISSNITLFGSPWSPPLWMKLNNSLQEQYVDAWVGYMVKYLQAYHSANLTVFAMTMQNEPLHDADSAWTMYMDASDQSILANKLGAAIASAGLKTKLWAYDHNTDVPDYPTTVLQNASPYVDSVAWHCYANPVDWTTLSTFNAAHPGVQQYMTECWTHLQDEDFFELPDFVTVLCLQTLPPLFELNEFYICVSFRAPCKTSQWVRWPGP